MPNASVNLEGRGDDLLPLDFLRNLKLKDTGPFISRFETQQPQMRSSIGNTQKQTMMIP
ncbi:hypothetical protein DPMN_180903 [Dreissena polymorpha]|uniref:Uncharacterized protein n=1 Tax=Dreissena polymorpha TaxID=45954 RepID=A0A9D4DDF1_DREPO|nr:hypothetical protein DPMN_180903 [Dreissena polymorpha]